MTEAHCLVVAKAPVPGEAKTRLAEHVGPAAAADLAAASLLDTLDACRDAFEPDRCHVALTGELRRACRGHEIRDRLSDWRVFAQQGPDLAARLVHAHGQVPGPVVQIGMDTPQVDSHHLAEVASLLSRSPAVLGPAEDGGWWVLGLQDPQEAVVLAGVPTSTPDTGSRTFAALASRGLAVATTSTLRDVDTAADAAAVAAAAPRGRFAEAWHATTAGSRG